MREHYEAVGKIAGAAHSLGCEYQGWTSTSEEGSVLNLSVDHETGHANFVANPHENFFTGSQTHEISNIEGVDVARVSEPLVQYEEEIKACTREYSEKVYVEARSYTPNGDAIEYFNGFRALSKIYPYESSFSPKELDRAICGINKSSWESFIEAVDVLGIEIELGEDAAEVGHVSQEDSPAFQ